MMSFKDRRLVVFVNRRMKKLKTKQCALILLSLAALCAFLACVRVGLMHARQLEEEGAMAMAAAGCVPAWRTQNDDDG